MFVPAGYCRANVFKAAKRKYFFCHRKKNQDNIRLHKTLKSTTKSRPLPFYPPSALKMGTAPLDPYLKLRSFA